MRRVLRVFGVLLVWGVFAGGALVRGGAAEYFVLAVLTVVIVTGLLLPYCAVRVIQVERCLPKERLRSGMQAEVRIEMQFKRVWPLVWISVREQLPPLGSYARLIVPTGKSRLHLAYTVGPLPRGVLHFAPVELVIGDWFGLVERRIRLRPEADQLLVLPKATPPLFRDEVRSSKAAASMSLVSGTLTARTLMSGTLMPGILMSGTLPADGMQSGVLPSSAMPSSAMSSSAMPSSARPLSAMPSSALPSSMLSAAWQARPGAGTGVRPYRAGDPIRCLDWRALARGRGWFVQTAPAASAQAAPITFVLDQGAGIYFYDKAQMWDGKGSKDRRDKGSGNYGENWKNSKGKKGEEGKIGKIGKEGKEAKIGKIDNEESKKQTSVFEIGVEAVCWGLERARLDGRTARLVLEEDVRQETASPVTRLACCMPKLQVEHHASLWQHGLSGSGQVVLVTPDLSRWLDVLGHTSRQARRKIEVWLYVPLGIEAPAGHLEAASQLGIVVRVWEEGGDSEAKKLQKRTNCTLEAERGVKASGAVRKLNRREGHYGQHVEYGQYGEQGQHGQYGEHGQQGQHG